MGYTATDSLAELFPEDWVDDTARDIARNVQDALLDSAVRRTPVAQLPEAYHGDFPSWEEDRGGRPPGTLKEAWVALPIEERRGVLRAPVENLDPIASHVEHDTQPHVIAAKKARVLRFPSGPVFRYREWVWHPGTQGQHMMRDSEAELSARWASIARRVIDLRSAAD